MHQQLSVHNQAERSPGKKRALDSSTTHKRVTRRIFFWAACLGLMLLFFNVLSSIMSSPLAYALPVPAAIQLKGSPSKPNTVKSTVGATSLTHLPPPAAQGSAKPGAPQIIAHNTKMPMQAGSISLQVGKAVSFIGSDKRLELQIPAGAITAQDLQAAGGKISLRVTQIAPPSGSNAGGSGEFSLGTYLVQLVDSQGKHSRRAIISKKASKTSTWTMRMWCSMGRSRKER